MSYAILRTAKLKSFGEIGGSLSHNYRTRHTPNADPTRTLDNHHSVSKPDLVMDGIKQRLPDKTRSNAVLCVEYLITASPEWSGWQDQKQEADFFRRSLEWLEHKHGKENVIATSIHRDETTPHLVAYVVPIDSNGKLNARSFLGGRATLSKMQTDFHAKVKDLGLERGLEGSKAEHKTVKEFYAELQEPLPKPEKINVNIQRIDKENQPKSPFYDTKYEHGVRVMDAVYSDIESQVNEIKKDFEIKLKEMQADFERNLRVERQKSEAQRKAHEKAVDALQKNVKNINDLKNEFKDFIRYKHLFPDLFDDIAFKLKSEIEIYDHKQGLEEYQKKFFADQKRLERAREMPEPVKIDAKELEYQEYLKKQADLEHQEWIESMKRERELEASRESYRERKALVDKEIAEMQKKPVNNDEIEPEPRQKNDFEP
ncbi:MobV family relaxase [Acinetobacter nosocomialis]|uniref:MobV family relaxase n=1 Tax=Acinetobacter nosocomialis TaxID=106654 RepID=UPI0024DE053D|nr:MobV family relaxase [Acinetobacter nosocomialis]